MEGRASLPVVTHTGIISLAPNIHLLDVLVVLNLTKKIILIRKLMSNFSLSR